METGKTILLISSCKIKELEDTFNKLYMQRGRVFETVYAASQYHGPVFIVDLRVDKLCTLGIDPKRDVVNDLYKMFQCCVIIYEQMNTLILCDEEDKCLFYSGNQIAQWFYALEKSQGHPKGFKLDECFSFCSHFRKNAGECARKLQPRFMVSRTR